MRVLVVGGGLIGSAIAWRLNQRGAQVTLIDAGNRGGEASPAGAGMLSPAAEGGEDSEAVALGAESLRLYPDFVGELCAASGQPVDFRITGCIANGVPYPNDALVDPKQLLAALHCLVRPERQILTDIDPSRWDAVVIAAGAWSSAIRIPGIDLPPCEPVKGHLLGFAMPPGLLGPFLREEATYVLQRADGFVVAGSNEERVSFDARVDPDVCAALHLRAASLLPELRAARPASAWTGFRPWSPGGPHIGRVAGTNVWLAYGHYRNGILLTPVTADRIAVSVLRDA